MPKGHCPQWIGDNMVIPGENKRKMFKNNIVMKMLSENQVKTLSSA